MENFAEGFRYEAFQNTAGARIFGEWALEKLAEDHFWLNGYVNKQNCLFWSEGQPEELQKLPMHPEKVTVWCGLFITRRCHMPHSTRNNGLIERRVR